MTATDTMTLRPSGVAGQFSDLHAANVDQYSFAGTALLGRMQLTGGTTHGTWLTDIDCTFTLPAVLPYVAVASQKILQILAIPVAGSGGVNVWLEINLSLETNGDICFYFDAGGGPSHISWKSAAIGDWHDGMDGYTGRFTCVAATGAVELFVDGVSVETGNIGAQTFGEPPDHTEVYAGSGTVLPVTSFTLKRSIGGATLFSFDASTPTGWVDADGGPTTAPTRPAYIGNDQGAGFFDNLSAFDIAADQDVTLAVALRPISISGDIYAVHNGDGLGSAQAWGLVYFPPDLAFGFALSDADANLVVADCGALSRTDLCCVAVLDRDAGTLTTFVDNIQTDQQDASALGAVSPDEVLLFGLNSCYVYGACQFDRLLTTEERDALPARFGI